MGRPKLSRVKRKTKVCNRCNKRKSINNFYIRPQSPDGYQYECIKCANGRIRELYQRQKKDFKNLQDWRDYIKNKNLHKVGLTLKLYEDLCKQQNYRCAICGKKTKLQVDHNHITGTIRGLICMNCNTSLGKLNLDSEMAIKTLLSYLKGCVS